jgi:hypothetical protein
MSPSNRHNPDTTFADGKFGWNVLAGFYRVRASATGCTAPGSGQPYVESATLTIPPAVIDIDLRLQCDATPPVTTLAQLPAANGNGWNKEDIAVTLTAVDELGGSGVKNIHYQLSGAQVADITVGSASATFAVTAEGITTIRYFAIDKTDNAEAAKTSTVRIDRTAPSVNGARLTPHNANGWNNGPVVVRFAATDAGSGIAGTDTVQVTLATAGKGQSVTRSFDDRAGNTASATVGAIDIDLLAPTTTATAIGQGQSGWYAGEVKVTLAASDDLSGVAKTEYQVDAGPWTQYASAFTITGDGAHTILYRSTDRADNVENARSLQVGIDRTPPEAYLRFDPTAEDLVLFGTDGGSGTSLAPVTPSISALRGGNGEQQSSHERSESRSYVVRDAAGNTLTVVVAVRRDRNAIAASITSIRYNGTPATTPAGNGMTFEWQVTRGALRKLDQTMSVRGIAAQIVEAQYNAARNTTQIQVGTGEQGERVDKDHHDELTMPGIVLLKLVTDHGSLHIDFH